MDSTASSAAEPSPANALVPYSPQTPAARQAPNHLFDLPTELLVMICNRVPTACDKLFLTQTCRRLRDLMCFATQMEIPEMLLMSLKAEKMHITKLRRIYIQWIHTIADQDPFLVVCAWCMTIHDVKTGRPKYRLPAVVQRVRKELFQFTGEVRRDCYCKTDITELAGEPDSTHHIDIQLAFKYRRLQMEDPEAIELLCPENRTRLEWGLYPRLRYESMPMEISTDKVQVNSVLHPKIKADKDGELRYILKTDIIMTSTQTRRVRKSRKGDFKLVPLTPSDIVAIKLCRHQMISPRPIRDGSSTDSDSDSGSGSAATRRYGNFSSALKCKWRRIKDRALTFFTRPRLKSKTFCSSFQGVPKSDYANEAFHRAIGSPRIRGLAACCPLCQTDFYFKAKKDGSMCMISVWHDFGIYDSPANRGWLQHAPVENHFYNVSALSLRGVSYRGNEHVSSPRRGQDYSALLTYECSVEQLRAGELKKPPMFKRLFRSPSARSLTITRSYQDNLMQTEGSAVDNDEVDEINY